MTATARQIAARTNTELAHLADVWENTTDMNGENRRNLVAALRAGKAWVKGPRTVAATVGGPEARRLSCLAGDVLDIAAGDEVFDTGRIDQISPTTWVLTW